MVVQMDELRPERSGCGSGLNWDARGMTSALPLYKLFKEKRITKVTWLNPPTSYSFIKLVLKAVKPEDLHGHLCETLLRCSDNFVCLKCFTPPTWRVWHTPVREVCSCVLVGCNLSCQLKCPHRASPLKRPHDVLDGSSFCFLAAASCFYSDQVRRFRYLSFHLNWPAVWRSDGPNCLLFWWQ